MYHILILGSFPSENVFSYRVSIPKHIIFPTVNWLTRLFALRLSPFEITLEVDSDTVNCVDVYEFLNDVYKLKRGYVDIAVMQTSKSTDPFHPQNGEVLVRNSIYIDIKHIYLYICKVIN